MADKILVPGSTDYSQAASYSPSGVPTGGDNLFVLEGAQVMTAGFATFAAVTLGRVIVGKDFRGSLTNGTASLQLQGCTSFVIESRESGFHAIDVGTCADLRVKSLGNARLVVSGGTITRADFWDGISVLVGASAVITNGYNVGADVTVEDNATGITKWHHHAGISRIKRDVAEWLHNSGSGYLRDTAEITTRLYMMGQRGVFYANGSDIEDIYGYAGRFTTEGALSDFEIGAGGSVPEFFQGFRFDVGAAPINVTLPATIRDHRYSGGSAVASLV